MATFVLVHGAFGGGWLWKTLPRRLRSNGHEVYTPTLTGLGERRHLLSRDVGLETHIQDTVNVLEFEDLRDVVLVGFSYGGMVITGVASRKPERLSQLVYLDALVPRDGESFLDLVPRAVRDQAESAVRAYGDGWLFPGQPPEEPRFGPQPFRTMVEPVHLESRDAVTLPRTYIRCAAKAVDDVSIAVLACSLARAKEEGWRYYEIPTLATTRCGKGLKNSRRSWRR